jgi:O-antigen/teichoic acid export membrane protein
VPLTLGYLGEERYGMWMTITAFIAVVSFADLGLGLGLLNAVADAHGKDDVQSARKAISSAFFLLLGIALTLAAGLALVFPHLPWPRIFNVKSGQAMAEAGQAMAVFLACSFANLPLGIVTRVQLGYQEGFANSLWETAGALLGLGGIILVVKLQAGLPWLVLAASGAPVATMLCNGLVLFFWRRPQLRPAWHLVSGQYVSVIMSSGFMFFLLQVAAALQSAVDNIIVSQVCGSRAVAEYSVVSRMPALVAVIISLILGPIWPAYTEAASRGDTVWIRRTLLRSLLLTTGFTAICATAMLVGGREIIRLWTGGKVVTSMALVLPLAIWAVLGGVGNAAGVFLNAINALKFQLICLMVVVPLMLVAKVLLISRYGLPGVVWGTVLVYIPFAAIPSTLYIVRILGRLKRKEQECDKRYRTEGILNEYEHVKH